MPLLFFFPFLTPALRFLAALAPDRSLRRLRAARAVLLQTAFALMRDHRAVLAKEARAWARACRQRVLLAVCMGAPLSQWVLHAELCAEGPCRGRCWLRVEGPRGAAVRMHSALAARACARRALRPLLGGPRSVWWHRLLALLMSAAGAEHARSKAENKVSVIGCKDLRTLHALSGMRVAADAVHARTGVHQTPVVRWRATANTFKTRALVAETGAVSARAPGQMALFCWSKCGLYLPLQAQNVRLPGANR